MILINGVKYACERCVRGHRASTCNHRDAKLIMIKPKGRPSTQCTHCKELRKLKNAHVACQCSSRHGRHIPPSKNCKCDITGNCDCCSRSKRVVKRGENRNGNIEDTDQLGGSVTNSALSPSGPDASVIAALDQEPALTTPSGDIDGNLGGMGYVQDDLSELPSPTNDIPNINNGSIIDAMSPEEFIDYLVKDEPKQKSDDDSEDDEGSSPECCKTKNHAQCSSDTSRKNHPKLEPDLVTGSQMFDDYINSGSDANIGQFIAQKSGDDLLRSLGVDDAIKSCNDETDFLESEDSLHKKTIHS